MKRVKNKLLKVVIIIVVVIGILVGCSIGYFFNFMYPYRETISNPEYSLPLNEILSRKQAIDDLEYLMKYIKNYHPIYLERFNNLTKALEDQYQIEIKSLGEKVTVLELWQSSERIASKLQDGHTSVSNNPKNDYYISDFSQVTKYGKPIAINGVKSELIFETYKTQSSYEIEAYAESKFYGTIIFSKQSLEYCGVDTSDGVIFTYQTDDGTVDYHYDFIAIDKVIGFEKDNSKEWVYYNIDTKNNLAVFTLKKCNYNKEYLSVLDEFFNEVDKNDITNIAVDLRNNSGGNTKVANAFLEYIDVDTYNSWVSYIRYGWYLVKNTNSVCRNSKKDVVFNGKIYVLTNIRTYSAAMKFAMYIKDNNMGYIVGETSGNMPNSYGDLLEFQMPNSRLCFNVSLKKWHRIDITKSEEALTPDFEVNSQKALEKVYEIIK